MCRGILGSPNSGQLQINLSCGAALLTEPLEISRYLGHTPRLQGLKLNCSFGELAMAKVDMETFFLVSSAGTGFFYTNRKNKRKGKGEKKLSKMKYDPIARKHVLFEEKKLSQAKKKKKGAAAAAPAATAAALS